MDKTVGGLTPSEQYLSEICRSSFLSLWSYSNPFTDRGVSRSNPQGKELCDLLVVFGRDVVIFSDKSCDVPDSGDVQLDWNRWYKRAVKKSAEQIYGAERWINRYPDRIYVDNKCTNKFPINLPSADEIRIHRIVVALGAGRRAEKYYGGGSRGSLMIVPSIIGDQHCNSDALCGPFRVGQPNPESGFVHIFDDVTLDIVLSELDTIYDFVNYLQEKERFLSSSKVAICHGEEELLSFYLRNFRAGGGPSFDLSSFPQAGNSAIVIVEGLWDEFIRSDLYRFQKEFMAPSYLIDKLIENVSTNIIDGTLAYGSDYSFASHEHNIRFLASESRVNRSMFAQAILQKVATTPPNMRTSLVLSSVYDDRKFVFLLVSRTAHQTHHAFRIARQNMLQAYAYVVKALNPSINYVYGLVTESGKRKLRRSEDFMSFDFREWTNQDQELAMRIKTEGKILDETSPRTVFDPPNVSRYSVEGGNRKQRRKKIALDRNGDN
ncbi:hypothetical protein [Methylobacterium sp. Leaf113]|uniref:hypothetical protein n=1 Tax=Methylobacterium sp. Leaf113 TaxID=1736259 RepID=UPI000AC6CF6A|nr:hypothetical protein [Methylobacterium sp. Leaf113]